MKIIYTSKFRREYRKLPNKVKDAVEQNENIFRNDPFHASLDTHKLHGRLKEFWSFSIGYKYRIMFKFANKNTVHLHSVGDHDIYR